ncbi:ABC transporter substrate-binding protein [Alkalithermobacter paradoxus]
MIIFLLIGCTDADIENDIDLEENEEITENISPKEGGSISISVVRFETLNPLLNKEKSLDYALKLVYDSLFTLDENYNVVPQLVKHYELSEDGISLRITLRDNAKWHDGANLTSDDVKFTIDFLKGNPESPYHPLVSNIYSVNIIDGKSFNISFARPYAFSLEKLVFPIVPRHRVGNLRAEDVKLPEKNFIGSGMYKITEYEKRRHIILTKNNDYYYKKPYIDEIKVIIVPDRETQENMLLSFEAHIGKVSEVISGKFSQRKFNIHEYLGEEYDFVGLNFNSEYIQDINFRKALAYAIDRKKILENAYVEKGSLVEFPLNINSKYYNKNIESYQHNIDKAREYLQKTEFEDIKLRLLVNEDNRLKIKTAYIIKECLEKLDIEVEIIELSSDDMMNTVYAGEYELALLGWKLPIYSDISFAFSSLDGKNITNYNDERMNYLLSKLTSSVNKEETIINYHLVQNYIKEHIPYISLVLNNQHIVLNNRIKGRLKPTDFNIYNGIEEIFVID